MFSVDLSPNSSIVIYPSVDVDTDEHEPVVVEIQESSYDEI